MKLKFFWFPYQNSFLPSCQPSAVNAHGISPIQQFLMDDGGGGESLDEYAAWITHALTRVDGIQGGRILSESLEREVMRAELGLELVTLSSHTEDDAYRQTIKIEDFRSVLVAWRQFILTEPGLRSEMEMELMVGG